MGLRSHGRTQRRENTVKDVIDMEQKDDTEILNEIKAVWMWWKDNRHTWRSSNAMTKISGILKAAEEWTPEPDLPDGGEGREI